MRHSLLGFMISLYVKHLYVFVDAFRRTVSLDRSSFCSPLRSVDSTLLGPRALDLEYSNGIRLVTGVYSFSWSSPDVPSLSAPTRTKAQVDLYSMLHIGDKSYYEEISKRMQAYDVVLYELITDIRNCVQVEGKDYKRQLTKEIYSKDASSLASRFGLVTQVDHLYNTMALTTDEAKNNPSKQPQQQHQWYIADLDAAEINRLEAQRRSITVSSFYNSRLAGRAWREQLIPSFQLTLPDAGIATVLRVLSWLAPCPEVGCLLLDWSRWRQPTKAGGVPLALFPIVRHLLRLDFAAARKLAFAQQLIAGIPDAGAWGGAALSDTEVRVHARNAECCRVLMGFLQEHQADGQQPVVGVSSSDSPMIPPVPPLKIAILYGAYHIEDLQSKLQTLGLRRRSSLAHNKDTSSQAITTSPSAFPSSPPLSQLAAWTMPDPQPGSGSTIPSTDAMSLSSSASTMPSADHLITPTLQASLSLQAVALVGLLAYLSLGALDWFLLLDFLVDTIRHLVTPGPLPHDSVVASWLQEGFGMGTTPSNSLTPTSATVSNINNIITSATSTINSITSSTGTALLRGSGQGLQSSSFLFSDNDRIFELSAATLYSLAYVQRHAKVLSLVSSVGVQWDRGLFDDDKDDNNDTI